jgi:hypothetical protein
MERNQMPLMRYFVFVGGALLALLLVANACLPALPATETRSTAVSDLSVIRIHSDRKWPERVVFDTSRPTIVPPAPVLAEAAPAPQPAKAAAPLLKTGVREAFAQVQNSQAQPSSARVEPKRKHKAAVARNYNYGYGNQQRIRVAQQPPVAFFGNALW